MPLVALVPARSPGPGKSRLAPELDVEQRAALGTAMLGDVVTALAASPVDRVVVAASGRQAAEAAGALGVEVLRDPPDTTGLDAAVAAAVSRLPGAAVLVVMSDLPCLTPTDVAALVRSRATVVIAPTEDGGTGGLLRRPAGVMPTAYGPGSGDRHARLAMDRDLTAEILRLPGFSHDLDTWEDLVALDPGRVGPRTGEFVFELDPRPADTSRDGAAAW